MGRLVGGQLGRWPGSRAGGRAGRQAGGQAGRRAGGRAGAKKLLHFLSCLGAEGAAERQRSDDSCKAV